MHPEYANNVHLNNIALIRLAEPATFSNYIRPACLPPNELSASEPLVLSGWPIRMYHVPLWSKTIAHMDLRKYIMETMPIDRCNEAFAPLIRDRNQTMPEVISERKICASIKSKARQTPELRPLEVSRIDKTAIPHSTEEFNSNLWRIFFRSKSMVQRFKFTTCIIDVCTSCTGSRTPNSRSDYCMCRTCSRAFTRIYRG